MVDAPKHNMLGERIFGELGKSIMDKPNMTALHREAAMMFPKNNTGEFLDRLDEDRRDYYLTMSRGIAPCIEKR